MNGREMRIERESDMGLPLKLIYAGILICIQ